MQIEKIQNHQVELLRPQYDLITSRQPRNLLYSGQGGGKTMCMGVLSYLLLNHCPTIPGMICANTYGQLSNSTLFRIFEVWKSLGWTEYDAKGNTNGSYVVSKNPPACFKPHGFTFESNHNKIFTRNGGVILTGSLDNYKAIDGTEVGWAELDETKDTKEAAVKEVILGRLRFKGLYINKDFNTNNTEAFHFTTDKTKSAGDINPLYVFTSPAKAQWLAEFFNLDSYQEKITSSIYSKDDYFYMSDNVGKRTVVIYSTYHNEANLPSDYIPGKIRDLQPELLSALLYGDPFSKTGGEYYSGFKKTGHIKKVSYTPGYPLHLSFDFNVNPYMPATLWQVVPVEGRNKVRCLAEFTMHYPKNTIEDLCRKFIGEYGHLCDAGLYYYGDASGMNTQPMKKQRNYYEVIEDELREYLSNTSKRVLRSNPRHRSIMAGTLGRRDLLNKAFSGGLGFDIEIDESCKHLIADLQFMKEDANGAKDKTKETINNIVCEKYGHCSDSMDYFVSWNWGDYR